jgi:hypothetical protein
MQLSKRHITLLKLETGSYNFKIEQEFVWEIQNGSDDDDNV